MNEALQETRGEAESQDPIQALEGLLRDDRRRGLAALNELFRNGRVAEPFLDGPYEGQLVALDIAPGLTRLLEGLASVWMPWKGKYLIRSDHRGDNIFSRDSRGVMRILFPFYKGMINYREDVFRAFVFDTSVQAGQVDPDRQVFRIDYNRKDNPASTIRRIVDEVVEVAEGVYLGKIHFKWWWGSWSMLGYFALRPQK
jgi:hypothetical protein